MTGALSFLDRVLAVPGVEASFIPRIPGIPLTDDKWSALRDLEPAHREAVGRLGFGWEDLWRAEQVHGDAVALVPMEGVENRVVDETDGLLTGGRKGVLLGIYVADCAAVYLCDRRTGALALVHSGMKGTERAIVVRALEQMAAEYGSQAGDIEAAISPCIRPPRYEVDFASRIAEQLRGAGVPSEQVVMSGVCTGENVKEFYSYRVERGKTGRMLALLGRRVENEGRS
ncbi:MAG: polyphenol oxidase family protein [Roseibacillus sp.]|nr:polyphenol oxidase family protein [Roseibacillus sp.]